MKTLNLENLQVQIAEQGALSETNQRIANYVIQHLRDVSLMSSTELATICNVSQPSISRFCMGLGYTGFSDFCHALQDLVREEWRAPDRTHFLQKSDLGEMKDPLLEEEISNLMQLRSIYNSPASSALVQFILRAQRLIIAGSRASATLIPYASYFLGKIRDRVEVATPETPLWTTLACHPQHDASVLVFIYPRYSAALLDWLSDVSQWATPIAAITDRPQSPARAWAHPMVVVPAARTSLFDSYAAPLVFLNYLVRQAAAQTPEIKKRLQKLEHYEESRHVYK